jgi:hypothetical protein
MLGVGGAARRICEKFHKRWSALSRGALRLAAFQGCCSMSITAVVEKDTIKLPEGVHLEDGTQVLIVPQPKERRTNAERWAKYIGCISTGIGDLAENHDHYLYGLPKKTKSDSE